MADDDEVPTCCEECDAPLDPDRGYDTPLCRECADRLEDET